MFMNSVHIRICDVFCFVKIGWIQSEKNVISYVESSDCNVEKSAHPSKTPRDIDSKTNDRAMNTPTKLKTAEVSSRLSQTI